MPVSEVMAAIGNSLKLILLDREAEYQTYKSIRYTQIYL